MFSRKNKRRRPRLFGSTSISVEDFRDIVREFFYKIENLLKNPYVSMRINYEITLGSFKDVFKYILYIFYPHD